MSTHRRASAFVAIEIGSDDRMAWAAMRGRLRKIAGLRAPSKAVAEL
jgi:hypothetical protein